MPLRNGPVVESAAVDELAHDILPTVVLADVVDGHDVRVVEIRSRLGLLPEAASGFGIGNARGQFLDAVNGVHQRGALAPQFPGAIGILPDAGLAEFELYLREALLAQIEVKDTP